MRTVAAVIGLAVLGLADFGDSVDVDVETEPDTIEIDEDPNEDFESVDDDSTWKDHFAFLEE